MRVQSLLIFWVFLLVIGTGAVSKEIKAVPQREEIADQYKWNLELIYPNIDEWEKDFRYIKDNYPKIDQYRGHLGESAEMLYNCLKLRDELDIILDKLSTYAGLKSSQDTRINEWQELSGRIGSLNSDVNHAGSFIQPEILTIENARLTSFLDNDHKLAVYRSYIERLIRMKQHILSPKEEAILALADQMASSSGRIFSRLTNADMDFGEIYDEDSNLIALTEERYEKFRYSTDRRVRKDNHKTYFKACENLANTVAATLDGSMRKDLFYMKARGYNDCLERSLYYNNIPGSVYYNLIETVNKNLGPLHKWAQLKKKTMGYDTLYPYDLYVSLVPESNKDYSYEEAVQICIDGLQPLGESYISEFKNGINSGWIDVFENEGKSSGAFSGGSYATPPYISLNFDGSVNWIFTLAHEMGHSMQSYYVNRQEPYINSNYPIFTAEVASTCNEALLIKYLLNKTTDKKEKMALLNYYIFQISTTFYRQVMFAEFELAIHKHIEGGGAFSADYFRRTFAEIYEKYWGEAVAPDELNSLLGMTIPHFYGQYYVYQYATSYAAAELISQKLIDGEPGYREKYLKFLATGSSAYPVEILKTAGVDMTSPEPIMYTIELFDSLVDELDKLLSEVEP